MNNNWYKLALYDPNFFCKLPLCKHIKEGIKIGKCKGCKQIIYDVNNMTNKLDKEKRIWNNAAPTTIIDGNIRVVSTPIFRGFVERTL
jgi:hypothetical protein